MFARSVFLEALFSLAKFLECQFKAANTDGFIAVSKHQFWENLNSTTLPVFAMDSWLREGLSYDDLDDYICIKKKYFGNIYVCDFHISEYKHLLQKKSLFQPHTCCKNQDATQQTQDFGLRIESFGNHAMILGINKHVTYQLFTNEATVKASGVSNADAQTILQGCDQEVITMFSHITAKNSS